MRIRTDAALISGLLLCVACGLSEPFALAQSLPKPLSGGAALEWILPQGTAVKDSGPRTYRMVTDYNTANTKGEIIFRQQVTGEYTRGLPNGEVSWKNVAVAAAAGPGSSFGAAEKRDFMEGFRYHDDSASTLKPGFFKRFPPTAVFERNLVWDTGMIEDFGQNHFEHLKLNVPYHLVSNEDAQMPDVGTFHNRDVVLEWVGLSERNGQKCALVKYQAFFNRVEIATGGMTLNGRSDYWGDIWVSLATKQIEYGTLYEVVVGEMKLPNQDATQVVNIFRQATLERGSAKQGSRL